MEICRADLYESKPLSHSLVITDLTVNDVFDGLFTWGHDFYKRGVWSRRFDSAPSHSVSAMTRRKFEPDLA